MFPAEVVLLPRPLTTGTGGGLVPGQQTKLTKTNQSDRTLNCSSFPTVYSASARPQWTEFHLMYCFPETSVCVKPGRYNPVCGATRRNAMHQPSAGWKEYLCTEQRPRPWPGLAGGHEWGQERGSQGAGAGASVSMSPCPLYPHSKTIASIRGRGDLDILISTHTQSSIINNGTQLIDNT